MEQMISYKYSSWQALYVACAPKEGSQSRNGRDESGLNILIMPFSPKNVNNSCNVVCFWPMILFASLITRVSLFFCFAVRLP